MTKHIKKVSGLSRREVLVGSAAGAGLVIGYSVLPNAVDSASKAIAAGNWDHQQFLTMDADGKATVHITKCEIGQHVGTALAQAVAEELDKNRRNALISRLDQQLINQAPFILLYYDEVLRFVHLNVEGMIPNPVNMLDLRRVRKKNPN